MKSKPKAPNDFWERFAEATQAICPKPPDGSYTSKQIREKLGYSKTRLRRMLGIMAKSGKVRVHKIGREFYYEILDGPPSPRN
jgi:AraC-like DNA-binding protein